MTKDPKLNSPLVDTGSYPYELDIDPDTIPGRTLQEPNDPLGFLPKRPKKEKEK